MAEIIQMMALSPTMENGTIFKWKFNEGDLITEGDVLCEIETDKATMEFESFNSGSLLKIIIPEGSSAAVGDPIAIVGKKDEDFTEILAKAQNINSSKPNSDQTIKEKSPENKSIAKEPLVSHDSKESSSTERIKISPLAKKIASMKNIDISQVNGTGPGGRVIKSDIDNFTQTVSKTTQNVATGNDRTIPLSGQRKIIAQRLSESKFNAPHYYLKVSTDFTSIISSRENIKEKINISMNSFLIKIAAQIIRKNMKINSTFTDEKIIEHGSIDIGIAVSLNDGLITPVLRNCLNKSISEIDNELKSLVELAKNGKLKPEQYTDATFTISNLGNWGIEEFTAIINPPGSAILAVGSIIKKPIVTDNEEIIIRPIVKLTLSCDHRIIDGAVGAQFLHELKEAIENPMMALI